MQLGRAYGVPVADDLGSGALVSLAAHGVPGDEPLVADSVAAGADLITASGDKLIGGPQMGIVVGSRECVARVRAHPLYRALRCDKLTLIAMEATLRLFLDGDRLAETHPTFTALTAAASDLERRAAGLVERLSGIGPVCEGRARVELAEVRDAVGAGSLPTVELPGWAARVTTDLMGPSELARRLRAAPVPVFTTVHDDAVHLHVRTLLPGDDDDVERALEGAFADASS